MTDDSEHGFPPTGRPGPFRLVLPDPPTGMLTSPFPVQEGRRSACEVFGSAATAPGRARVFVRRLLRGWELAHLADTAELVVSELVTNAVRATDAVVSPPVAASMFPVALRTVALRVRVASGRRGLVIEVWDGSDREPVAARGDVDGEPGESGRGLMLVGSLARRWGHYSAPDRGKIVWCELAITPVEPSARTQRPAGDVGADRERPDRERPDRERPDRERPDGVLTGVAAACDGREATGRALPRRVRRHPVGARTDGPDAATLLRVLEGLRALDAPGPDRG